MTYESNTGLGVANQYGPRKTGSNVGVEREGTSEVILSIEFDGETLNHGFLPKLVLPRGTHFRRAMLRVDQAFSLTGTTPVVRFGSQATIGTNYFELSEAELEAVGTKVPADTGTGTWSFTSATGITASDQVDVALAGTSPVADPTLGKATLMLEFVYNTLI